MRDRRVRKFVAVVLSVVLLVALAGVASASLQTTNILRAWDDGLGRYENGNLGLLLNAVPEPFYTQMAWDAKPHADACGPNTSSAWAGDATIGLYHQDTSSYANPNDPNLQYDPNAPINGFVSSQNWKIVKCSAFANNYNPVTANGPVFAAGDVLADCVQGTVGDPTVDKGCVIMEDASGPIINRPVKCTTGNCAFEVETKFHVNTDLDCINGQDANFAGAGDLCVYWEGTKPSRNTRPLWSGNIQVRYGTGQGGDKTINFAIITAPNAVGLRNFEGASTFNLLPIGLAVVTAALGGLALVWRLIELRGNAK